MARTKQTAGGPSYIWVLHRYKDHAGQPATLFKNELISQQVRDEYDMAPPPEFAFQVYSTIPLDPAHLTDLRYYLSQEIDFAPQFSFEIYSPQPDAFACVEHQRREIAHRKRVKPGEAFFPGIAKVEGEGLLVVITADWYKVGWRGRWSEDPIGDDCPLLVHFNRCFPQNTSVNDSPLSTREYLNLEQNEVAVIRCPDIRELCSDLKSAWRGSFNINWEYDYGLDDDEEQPYTADHAIQPKDRELLDQQANSRLTENLVVRSEREGVVTVTINSPPVLEPESSPVIRYIIHVTFPHSAEDLITIARAFTSSILDTVGCQQPIHLEFHSSHSSISSIIASHRDVVNSRPGMDIGTLQSTASSDSTTPTKTRVFPQPLPQRNRPEPYQTFAVIIDRPDFLTAPGVLFLAADVDRAGIQKERDENPCSVIWRKDFFECRVWRCVGMSTAAKRLAMLPLDDNDDDDDEEEEGEEDHGEGKHKEEQAGDEDEKSQEDENRMKKRKVEE